MAFVRSPVGVGIEPFYGEVIAGMEDVLHERGINVLMQVVDDYDEELATYRRWAQARAVAGIVLTNLTTDDSRAEFAAGLGLPSVTLGEPSATHGQAVVRVNNYAAMRDAVRQLVALGHRRIGRVSGPVELVHTRARTEAFDAVVAETGISARLSVGDYSAESGDAAVRNLLDEEDPPTAIVFDNDVMAVAGLAAAQQLGVPVPDRLALLAWDDSALCRMTSPPLSAMSHDVHQLGQLAANALVELIERQTATDVMAPEPVFIARGTTALPAATRGARTQHSGVLFNTL